MKTLSGSRETLVVMAYSMHSTERNPDSYVLRICSRTLPRARTPLVSLMKPSIATLFTVFPCVPAYGRGQELRQEPERVADRDREPPEQDEHNPDRRAPTALPTLPQAAPEVHGPLCGT